MRKPKRSHTERPMERPHGKQLSPHTDSQHQLPDMGMNEPSDESSSWLRVFHFKPQTLWSRNTSSPLCPSKSLTHRICERDTWLFMPEKLEQSNSVWVYIDGVRNCRSYCCEQPMVNRKKHSVFLPHPSLCSKPDSLVWLTQYSIPLDSEIKAGVST